MGHWRPKASYPQRNDREPIPLEFLDLRFYHRVQSQLGPGGFGPYPLPACKDGPLRRYGHLLYRRAVPQYWLLGGGSTASYITATTDYFFLLSEYEVFGNITYSNSYEANYQQQYAYYSAGNSKVKYRHNSTGSAAYWWLRSPYAGNSHYFVSVRTDGTVYYYIAYFSLGFAPGFDL